MHMLPANRVFRQIAYTCKFTPPLFTPAPHKYNSPILNRLASLVLLWDLLIRRYRLRSPIRSNRRLEPIRPNRGIREQIGGRQWIQGGRIVLQAFLSESAELIRNQGYPEEDHHITTHDGYILGCQRIPHGIHGNPSPVSPKPAILLVHGLTACSTNWITNLANESLAYILADAGYDVWLANVRGNIYSQQHVSLSNKSKKFWNFSWQEMAEYDIPAMVDYILGVTGNEQMYYVGHSQGTLIAFAKLSSDLEFAKKKLADLLGDYQSGDLTWILDYVKPVCDNEIIDKDVCENLMFFLLGSEDTKLLNQTRVPVYIAHNPAGTSMKDIAHFGQNVNSKKMQKFDYGIVGNILHYGQMTAPIYDVGNMKTYTVLFWSEKDALADPKDVAALLPKIQHHESHRIDDYSHLDFLFAMNARALIYERILKVLKNESA